MSLLLQIKLLINLNLNYTITIYIKVHQYKILKLLFQNTTHDICHHIFMYNERDKNTNSQINSSTKHVLNTYGGAQNEIYCN